MSEMVDDEIDRIDLRIDIASARKNRERRERIAASVLPALVAMPAFGPYWNDPSSMACAAAVKWADALIAELDK